MRSDLWSEDELIVVCHIYRMDNLKYDNKVRLAVLETGRSEGSIKRRFGNYQFIETDGEKGLSNGGRNVERIWSMFEDSPNGMDSKVRSILDSGLVGSLSNSDSEQAVEVGVMDMEGGYREYTAKFRVNQDKLRRATLECAGNRCCITDISEPTMLVASHIKPWSRCTPREKTDVHNALCLNRFHENLFDGYRMTVNDSMEVIYDPKLEQVLPERVYRNFIKEYNIIKVNDSNRPGEDYLRYHNARFTAITGVKI